VGQLAGPGEAVAGDAGDGGVQDRQRAMVGVLGQQPPRRAGEVLQQQVGQDEMAPATCQPVKLELPM
jgi:hypothetical protein